MTQALHIFRKDVRHFWKEIILSWCLLALFAWQAVRQWDSHQAAYAGFGGLVLQTGPGFTSFLILLSWAALLVRLIHDESLVGARQFWVTRPYRWITLLIEKIVFVLFFVNIPLLTAQLAMLKCAGFSALPHLGGLLEMEAGWSAIFLVPVFLLAILTSTFVQVLLALFVVALYIVGNSALSAQIPNASMQHAEGALDLWAGIFVVSGLIAVVLLQYANRRTITSRVIVVAIAALVTLVEIVTPYDSLIAKEFPDLGSPQATPLRIVLDTRKPEKPSGESMAAPRQSKPEKDVNIAIPVIGSATNDGDLVFLNGIRVSLDLSGGKRWQSNWQRVQVSIIVPDTPSRLWFTMPTEVFDLIKSTPLELKVEMALSIHRRGNEQWQVIAQEADFIAPKIGICSGLEFPSEQVRCRAPIHGADPLLGTVNSAESTCPAPPERKSDQPIANVTGYFWNTYGMGHSEGALMDPVVEQTLYFHPVKEYERQDDGKHTIRICPGTPMRFVSLEFVRRGSTSTWLEGIRLLDYQLPNRGQFVALHAHSAVGIDVR